VRAGGRGRERVDNSRPTEIVTGRQGSAVEADHQVEANADEGEEIPAQEVTQKKLRSSTVRPSPLGASQARTSSSSAWTSETAGSCPARRGDEVCGGGLRTDPRGLVSRPTPRTGPGLTDVLAPLRPEGGRARRHAPAPGRELRPHHPLRRPGRRGRHRDRRGAPATSGKRTPPPGWGCNGPDSQRRRAPLSPAWKTSSQGHRLV
jgi:hypothetical protein